MKENKFTLADLLLPYQRKFVEAPQRKKIWVAGRQLGKSFAIAFIMCLKVLQKKGTLGLCVSTGSRAASELLKKCKQMAEAIKVISNGAITYTDNSESITFSTGSRIISLPSNPDGIRGYTAAIVCIDEAAFVPFVDDIYQAIAPTLTRDKHSELILCSTPAGCSGLFYDLIQNASDDWYVQTTTIEDAIADGLDVDLEELKKLVKDPDIFNQEYMCKFSKEYGSFIDTSILDWYEKIPAGESGYYLGMDVGRKHDRTGISIIKSVGEKLFLENIIALNKCPYSEQVQVIRELHNKYNFTAGLVDEGGIGSALSEQITKEVTGKIKGLAFTASNKTPMYEAIRAKIFDHKLWFNPEHKAQIVQDFRNVHRLVTETGQVKFQAGRDENGHSDIASSLVLAVEAATKSPISIKVPQTYTRTTSLGARLSPKFARFY